MTRKEDYYNKNKKQLFKTAHVSCTASSSVFQNQQQQKRIGQYGSENVTEWEGAVKMGAGQRSRTGGRRSR